MHCCIPQAYRRQSMVDQNPVTCRSAVLGYIYILGLPYSFSCKTEVFSFQNNPKDLDPSCKMDLDPCDCLGRVKLVL